MPVTAKLSRAFYEKLGDDVANELVEWFNAVDATYRSDLKEVNELNFQRFAALQDQRWADYEARMERRLAQMERSLLRWMLAFLAPTALAVIGLMVSMIGLWLRWRG